MIYLLKFETHSEYADKKDSLLKPWVAICSGDKHVHFSSRNEEEVIDYLSFIYESTSTITDAFMGWETIRTIADKVYKNGQPYEIQESSNYLLLRVEPGVNEFKITFKEPLVNVVKGNAPWFASSSGQNNVKSVTFPDSVKTIGTRTFESVSGLKNIKFSKNLESIGNYAFNYCHNIEEIILPDSCVLSGESVFYDPAPVKAVNINLVNMNTSNSWSRIEYLVLSDETVGGSANLMSNSTLKYLEFKKATYINHSIRNMSALEELVLPENLETITTPFLQSCNSLKSFTLPDSVILDESTSSQLNSPLTIQCPGLKNVTLGAGTSVVSSTWLYYMVYADTLIENLYLKGDALKPIYNAGIPMNAIASLFNSNNVNVYVPNALVAQYKANADWGQINNIKGF